MTRLKVVWVAVMAFGLTVAAPDYGASQVHASRCLICVLDVRCDSFELPGYDSCLEYQYSNGWSECWIPDWASRCSPILTLREISPEGRFRNAAGILERRLLAVQEELDTKGTIYRRACNGAIIDARYSSAEHARREVELRRMTLEP